MKKYPYGAGALSSVIFTLRNASAAGTQSRKEEI